MSRVATVLSSVGLLLCSSALAFDAELSAELGTLHNGDPAYDLFSDANTMGSVGVRAGVGVLGERVSVTAGWHRVRRGQLVGIADSRESFIAAFYGDQFTLGPKAGVLIQDIFYPYGTLQAVAFRGLMRLDDDTGVRTNPGQLQAGALSFGGLLMAGAELRAPQGSGPVTAAVHLEMGYGLLTRATYAEFGTMQPGGFVLRSGVGLRF